MRHGVEEHELRASSVMTGNVPVVPSRESLHAGSGNAGAPAGIQTRNSDRFFTRHAPPSGAESFHDQAARVQRVVGPEAAGATHGNSGIGANARTGNTEGPRSGSATAGSASSNSAQDRSRGGWNKFGSPTSHSGGDAGNGRSESSGNIKNSSGTVNDHQMNDHQTNGRQSGERPGSSGNSQSSDRSAGQTSRTPESGWQKFPSSADRGAAQDHSSGVDHGSGPGISAADRVDRTSQGGSGGNSRPPLDMHRPIVTPREQPGSQPRNSAPAQRNEPRYNPPAPRNESRGSYSGSHSSGGSSSHSGGGGSSSHSGGGGHSESHSGSGSSSHHR